MAPQVAAEKKGLTSAKLVIDVRHLQPMLLGIAAQNNQKLGILAALIKVRPCAFDPVCESLCIRPRHKSCAKTLWSTFH